MSEENKLILIVEDDTFLSNIYNKKLTKEGFNIMLAGDGEEGLAMIKKEKPALVLLDIILPKLDGFGVLEAKQQDEEIKDIPVIILSNLGQDSDVTRGKELGAKDFVVKSDTTLEGVVEKIRQYL